MSNQLEEKYIENLLKETTDLIDMFGELDNSTYSEEMCKGSVNISFDGDKMVASMEIIKPVNCENEITINDIKQQIDTIGEFFASTVDWGVIHDLYTRVMEEDEIVHPVPIAFGSYPQEEIPSHILLNDGLTPDKTPSIDENGNADYHHIHALVFVSKDQEIGQFIAGTPGKNGRRLDGTEIIATIRKVKDYTAGENCYKDENKIYSSIEGTLRIENNTINISPCLHIASDIDYSTGDISFTGDIEISGTVRSGFHIEGGGDIHIKGTVEPANIVCKNSLIVNEGIYGSSRNVLLIKGDLITKHIENTNIKSLGNINISKCLINSNIYTCGDIVMEKNTTILGTKIKCNRSIKAYNIGAESGTSSDIRLGINYIIEGKLIQLHLTEEKIKKEMIHIQRTLHKIHERSEKNKQREDFICLKNRLNTIHKDAQALLQKLESEEESFLEVEGTIFPGTRVTIKNIHLSITQPLSSVTLYLNKRLGRIEWKSSKA